MWKPTSANNASSTPLDIFDHFMQSAVQINISDARAELLSNAHNNFLSHKAV